MRRGRGRRSILQMHSQASRDSYQWFSHSTLTRYITDHECPPRRGEASAACSVPVPWPQAIKAYCIAHSVDASATNLAAQSQGKGREERMKRTPLATVLAHELAAIAERRTEIDPLMTNRPETTPLADVIRAELAAIAERREEPDWDTVFGGPAQVRQALEEAQRRAAGAYGQEHPRFRKSKPRRGRPASGSRSRTGRRSMTKTRTTRSTRHRPTCRDLFRRPLRVQ
jgi:hypothetical protein